MKDHHEGDAAVGLLPSIGGLEDGVRGGPRRSAGDADVDNPTQSGELEARKDELE